MGYWGIKIFEDDITCDAQDEFNKNLKMGRTPEEASESTLERLLKGSDEPITNLDSKYLDLVKTLDRRYLALIYIGLAATQLEMNCLQDKVKRKAIEYIEDGADLDFWGEEGGENYEVRKKVLDDLKQNLLNYQY